MNNSGFNVQTLIAHNFQSHKHTVVNFSPYLNVICGESDKGKTSLCSRSFSWVLNNDLSGDYFVRNNDNGKTNSNGELLKEDECYSTIIFENGISLTRKKIKSKNIYELIDENGEVFEFENFGNEVPEKIKSIIPLGLIKIDKDLSLNANFPPKKEEGIVFKPNGVKTKIIGSFCNTHIVDAALREKNAEIINISTEKNSLEKEIKDLDNKISTFGDMKKKKDLIENGEVLYNEIQILNQKEKRLYDLFNTKKEKEQLVESLNKVIKQKGYVLQEEKYLKILENKIIEINKQKEMFDKINSLYSKLNKMKESLETNEKIISKKETIIDEEIKLKNLEMKVENIKLSSTNIILKRNILISLGEKYKKFKNSLLECERVLKNKENLSKIEKIVLKLENKLNEIKKQNEIFTKIKQSNSLIKEKEKTILSLNLIINNKINIVKLEKSIIKKEKTINDIKNFINKNKESLNLALRLNKDLTTKKEKENKGVPILNRMKKELDQLIDSYVQDIKILGKCPVCYSDLTPEHMANIKEEIIK